MSPRGGSGLGLGSLGVTSVALSASAWWVEREGGLREKVGWVGCVMRGYVTCVIQIVRIDVGFKEGVS